MAVAMVTGIGLEAVGADDAGVRAEEEEEEEEVEEEEERATPLVLVALAVTGWERGSPAP